MLQHFVLIIMLNYFIYFIMAFPTEFLLLLPFYHNCKWISFGGIMIGFGLTIFVMILYYLYLEFVNLLKKTKY